jgi:hypothetical protein
LCGYESGARFSKGRIFFGERATLEAQPLTFKPAHSFSRIDAPCFVGFYADLSSIAPAVRHTIELRAPQMARHQLQGVSFGNVTPQVTEDPCTLIS